MRLVKYLLLPAILLSLILLPAGPVYAASFPVIVITPLSVDFGVVEIGLTSPPATVTVGNQPGATFTLAVLGVRIEGPAAAEFSVVDDKVSGSAMDGGMTAALGVVFKPAHSGQRSADLVISANGGINLELIDYRVPLTGFAAGSSAPESSDPAGDSLPAVISTAGSLSTSLPAASPVSSVPAGQSEPSAPESNNLWIWIVVIPAALMAAVALVWQTRRVRERRAKRL